MEATELSEDREDIRLKQGSRASSKLYWDPIKGTILKRFDALRQFPKLVRALHGTLSHT